MMAAKRPAKSKEDDLELTRAVIMRHIASSEDEAVYDEDDDDDESPKNDGADDALQKIKSIGTKVKSKVRSKAGKLKSKVKSRLERGSD